MTAPPASSPHPAGYRRALTIDEERWLRCAGSMAAAGKQAAAPLYGTALGRTMLGRGAGGDRTLELDRACESAIFAVLEKEAPHPHRLVSEEAGATGPADAPWVIVVDPLDGSLNAKRGLEPFGASIAVARGETLGDVAVGYVEDYTRQRAFAAVQGAGLVVTAPGGGAPCAGAGAPADSALGPSGAAPGPSGAAHVDPGRFETETVEVVLLEAGRPDRHRFEYRDLSEMGACGRSQDMRIRQIGSLALSLCYIAVGVADILVAGVKSRSVDLAAGLLVLREAGGKVATFSGLDILEQPLDLEKRCAFVAWRAGLPDAEVEARARRLGKRLLGA